MALGEVCALRHEVEFEAEGAGAGAGEAGEGDDEVLLVGVVGVLGYAKQEGDFGGAFFGKVFAAGGKETLTGGGAVCGGAVGLIAEVLACEVFA